MFISRLFVLMLLATLSFTLVSAQTQTSASANDSEKKDEISFEEIRKLFIFRSHPSESDDEINKKAVARINAQKVNFVLTSEDENSLKNAGGNELLIKTIRENLSKELEEQIILYKKFTDNYNGRTVEKQKIALEAAKEFIKKYSDDESVKEIVKYLTAYIPNLERIINCCPPDRSNENYIKFDTSFKAKRWKDLFDAGAEILIDEKNEPVFVDVTITLASVGFDNLVNESNRDFLNETLDYAEKSINLLETEKAGKTDLYGIYNYSLRTKEFPDGKANALGYMNYIVGYVKYFYIDQIDEAVSYFQKSLKYKSKAKDLIRQLNLPLEIKQ